MTNVNEIWLPVKDYEGLYEISNFGRLKSNAKILQMKGNHKLYYPEKIMNLSAKSRRYYQVKLYNNNKYKYCFIHRLVALHFIENKFNKPQINHKDGNRLNNHFTNLEWCTPSENIQHAVKTGLKLPNKVFGRVGKLNGMSKVVYCTKTGRKWESIRLAAKDIGIKPVTLSWNLNNQHKNKTTLAFLD